MTTARTPLTLDTSTRLAIDRTRLAYERTLMAWVRTAASLISFGFTIYKFFQYDLRDRAPDAGRMLGPREFALTLITIGLVSLLLSTYQHRQSMRHLRAEYGNDVVPWSTSTIVASLFIALGIVAVIVVLLRR